MSFTRSLIKSPHASAVCIIHHLFFPTELLMHHSVSNKEKIPCTVRYAALDRVNRDCFHTERENTAIYLVIVASLGPRPKLQPPSHPRTSSSNRVLSSDFFPLGEISSSLPNLLPPSRPCQKVFISQQSTTLGCGRCKVLGSPSHIPSPVIGLQVFQLSHLSPPIVRICR